MYDQVPGRPTRSAWKSNGVAIYTREMRSPSESEILVRNSYLRHNKLMLFR